MSDTPFFARFLDTHEMQQITGGEAGGNPNSNASTVAFLKNPNATSLVAVTLKAGAYGNDCDQPGPCGHP